MQILEMVTDYTFGVTGYTNLLFHKKNEFSGVVIEYTKSAISYTCKCFLNIPKSINFSYKPQLTYYMH